MTITIGVQRQFFGDALPIVAVASPLTRVIRLPSTPARGTATTSDGHKGSLWTQDEHERFLSGLELYPRGPWKLVAEVVATRSTRQVMTHAQKYRQRIARHARNRVAYSADSGTTKPPRRRQKMMEVRGERPDPAAPTRSSRQARHERNLQAATQKLESVDHSLSPELVAVEWLLEADAMEFGPRDEMTRTDFRRRANCEMYKTNDMIACC